MLDTMNLKKIATIYTEFPEKFGIPRQSGLAKAKGKIVFEPKYRNPDALKGIEQYSHLWIIWGFSEVSDDKYRPMVRPPRLGGNKRMGVFATRSPFRPNPIGLSLVELIGIEKDETHGICLNVSGVDMLDGTPIYDIKPYLPYVESIENAKGGFAEEHKDDHLEVRIPDEFVQDLSKEDKQVLLEILSEDPRPSYQDNPERVYGMKYGNLEIKFRVADNQLYVTDIKRDEDVR